MSQCFREQHGNPPDQKGIAETAPQSQQKHFPHTLHVIRPIVKADNGLHPLGQALKGHHGKLHHTGQNRHCPHRYIAPIPLQGSIKADGQKALRGLHNKGRDSQRQNRPHNLKTKSKIGSPDMEDRFRAAQETDYPDCGHRLRQDCGQCSPPYPHVESEDKYRIQYNVQPRADHNRLHSHRSKALRGYKSIQPRGQKHTDASADIDPHIGRRIAYGVGTGSKGIQNRFRIHKEPCCQCHGHTDQRKDTIPQNLFRGFIIAFSHGNGSSGRTAETDQRCKCRHQHYHRQSNSKPCQRHSSHSGNMADVNAVNHIVKQINNLCRNGRSRQR